MTIKEIRAKTGLSQAEFGKKYYDIPVGNIRDWEQGRRNCANYLLELLNFKVEHDLKHDKEYEKKKSTD